MTVAVFPLEEALRDTHEVLKVGLLTQEDCGWNAEPDIPDSHRLLLLLLLPRPRAERAQLQSDAQH